MSVAVIKEYLREISASRSPATIRSSTEYLTRLGKFLKDRPFTRANIVEFLESLKKQRFSESYISVHHSVIRTFFVWLTVSGYIDRNCLEKPIIATYKSPKRDDSFPFTEEEYEQIKKQCLTIQHEGHLFWHDAVVCAWHTGLRMHDISFLHRNQVDLQAKRISLKPSKTRRVINRAVDISIKQELFDVLSKSTFEGYFFPEMAKSYKLHGNKYLSAFFGKKILLPLGIKGKSFHSFRHRMTTALLNSGAPLGVISTITGQSVATIQRYSHNADFKDVTKYMEALT